MTDWEREWYASHGIDAVSHRDDRHGTERIALARRRRDSG
jgi:hypothetical protein